jgi:hypothetical protein
LSLLLTGHALSRIINLGFNTEQLFFRLYILT